MKKTLALIVAVCAFTLNGYAADTKKNAAPEMDPKQAEMMKAWKEASTPGPEHDLLKSMVGKWKVTTKSWMSEGSKPEETTGTSTFKTILGGRFVQQNFKGKMMGQPYEGTGTLGFNKVTKKYESTWTDNMSTETMILEGTMNASTNTIEESGEFHCPIKKGPQKMRTEFKIIDKNNATFTMYMPDMETGKEFKSMEQVYKR